MCGLVVTASFEGEPADAAVLRRSSDVLAHRGPDDSGVAVYGAVGFGFRRLSILDLSPAGHQPMESPDGRLSVVFNGEIYNYVELRAELEQLGRTFRSSSDTEVLLQAYDTWGGDCVRRFNGMWALVIFDRVRRRLFASRDRFGVKPLYRWTDGKRLVLASEIKAIVATGWYAPTVNWTVASRFLCRGHLDEDTQTFYEKVDQLPPGSTWEVDLDGQSRERRFWSLDAIAADVPADPVAVYREMFEDAVRVRMRSDVPVGVSLSGGIDSSAIISMMAKLRDGKVPYPLHAFSYIPEEFGEGEYIHESIRRTRATLNELSVTPRQLWDIIPTVLWHHDEPVHSPTALIGFELMRLARSKGVTVVLNGQGADEVNAGYHSYFKAYWTDLMRAGRWKRASSEIAQYSRNQGQGYWPLLQSTAGHFARTRLRQVPGYSVFRTRHRHDSPGDHPWYAPDLVARLPALDTDLWSDSLDEALTYSVERRPLPLYLRVEDRNSMAHSVEARLPFLDYRLVTLAFSLPPEWKLRGPWNKFVVREAMKGIIAEPVRTRLDKMGFPTPNSRWFADAWHDPARDLLNSRALRESGFLNVKAVTNDLERHRRGDVDVAGPLFQLAEFGMWIDRTAGGASAGAHGEARHVVSAG